MKILVLGCKGQLGQCLNDQLAITEHDVVYASREQIDIADFEANAKQILNISARYCNQCNCLYCS